MRFWFLIPLLITGDAWAAGARSAGTTPVTEAARPAAVVRPTNDAPDAREAIVDGRHGRLAGRHRFLGWTARGDAVVRWTEPAASALIGFDSGLTIAGDGAERRVWLARLACDEVACPIPYADARDFIVAERRAYAALPPLQEGTRLRTAKLHLALRKRRGDHSRRRPYGGRLELVRVERGKAYPLAVVADAWRQEGDDPERIEDARVVGVYASPDGAHWAVLVEWTLGFNCWSATELETVVITAPAVREE